VALRRSGRILLVGFFGSKPVDDETEYRYIVTSTSWTSSSVKLVASTKKQSELGGVTKGSHRKIRFPLLSWRGPGEPCSDANPGCSPLSMSKTSWVSQSLNPIMDSFSGLANLSKLGSFSANVDGILSDQLVSVISPDRIVITSCKHTSVTTTESHYIVLVVKMNCDFALATVDVYTTTRGFNALARSQFCCFSTICAPLDDTNQFLLQSRSKASNFSLYWSLPLLEPNSALVVAEVTSQYNVSMETSVFVHMTVSCRNGSSSDSFRISAWGLDRAPLVVASVVPAVIVSQRQSTMTATFDTFPQNQATASSLFPDAFCIEYSLSEDL